MKKLLLLLMLLASSVSASHNNAALLMETVRPLQMKTEEGGFKNGCTVFSANPQHQEWATVAHCVYNYETSQVFGDFYIAEHPAKVTYMDHSKDFAMLQVTDGWRVLRGLKMAKQAPKVGDLLETMGYSYGAVRPFYFAGYLAIDHFASYRAPNIEANYAVLTSIVGQSGSPILNEKGELVGLLHIGFGGTGEADPLTGITPFLMLKQFKGLQ